MKQSDRYTQPLAYERNRTTSVCALVALTLATAGLLAAWLPARRAATIDPLISIRH